MTTYLTTATPNLDADTAGDADGSLGDAAFFDLDIRFIEAGDTVDHIIKMTDDNCGTTCQSACTSC